MIDDVHCFQLLASLLSTSNRDAVSLNHIGLDKTKIEATQLIDDNQIFQRHDSRAYSMQSRHAQILHNCGSLDKAARIRRSVLDWRRKHAELEDPYKLVEALRSYAQSLMALGDISEAKNLLKEALKICRTSLAPGNMHALDCKEALAVLHKIEGHTTEAIEVSDDVLRIRQESLGNTYPQTIGTMSDLALYLALASRWEESMEMIDRAKIFARENLNNQDAVNIAVHLNASYLSELMCLPVTVRGGRVVAIERGGRILANERGGKIIAICKGGRDTGGPISTQADEEHDRDHGLYRHLLRKMMIVPARCLHKWVPHTRSKLRD